MGTETILSTPSWLIRKRLTKFETFLCQPRKCKQQTVRWANYHSCTAQRGRTPTVLTIFSYVIWTPFGHRPYRGQWPMIPPHGHMLYFTIISILSIFKAFPLLYEVLPAPSQHPPSLLWGFEMSFQLFFFHLSLRPFNPCSIVIIILSFRGCLFITIWIFI